MLWEVGYLLGRWEYLASDQQAPRYRAVASAVDRGLTVAGAVLDVGCGSGALVRYLSPPAATCYIGIDISPTAIAKARRVHAGRGSKFLVADLRSWAPSTTAAVVVFNETLYYMRKPLAVIRRYAASLGPDGELVVSMYHRPWLRNPIARARVDAIWRGLARSLQTVDVQIVFDTHGHKRCRVARFAPRQT